MKMETMKQILKIALFQFFVTITMARVLPQMDRQYQPRISPESRFGPGPILTPVKFLRISKLQSNQLPYEGDLARANDLQNGVNNGGMQTEYLEPIAAAPKQIKIELPRGSNKRVSITHRSGRRIHLTLRGRQDAAQTSPRQVRVMFKNRPQNVAMDMPVNDFASETPSFRTAEASQRGTSKIVLFRNNQQNRAPQRVIVRSGAGSGSSNRRVLRIRFVRNNNNDVIQRGTPRSEITMPSVNIGQASRMNANVNIEATSGLAQDQGQSIIQSQLQEHINGQVLAEIKGKIESLLQGQLKGRFQEKLNGESRVNPIGKETSSPIPVDVVDIEEPEITPSQNGKVVKPSSSPKTKEQPTASPVDAEAEEI
ncbi:uncharacterized protein [Argopecten irradians]|uniref:uncharacterized protein n=1 Tax=Argopecten irradians TaxID=31199 RepID=UPI0037204A76